MSALPAGWAVVRLHEVALPDTSTARPSIGTPYLGLDNVEPGTNRILGFADAAEVTSHGRPFSAGSVLYSRLRPYLNKVCLPSVDGLASAEFLAFPPSGAVEQRFLLLLLSSPGFVAYANASSQGIARPRLSWSRMGGFEFSMPPLPEQCRIVAAIEEQFSRLDAADSSLDLAALRLGALREGVRDAALSNAGAAATLSDVLDAPLVNGRSVRSSAGGFPVLRLTSVRQGRIDPTESKEGEWTRDEAAPWLIREADFLVVRGNGSLGLVGRGGLVSEKPSPVAFPDTLIRVRVNTQLIEPAFLGLVWDGRPIRAQIESQARTTAGIYKINQTMLLGIRFPLPTLSQQREIVAEVEQRLSVIDAMAAAIESAQRRSAALRRAILERAFRGELVPQDPSDEPASVLLERIRAERAAAGTTPRRSSRRPARSGHTV